MRRRRNSWLGPVLVAVVIMGVAGMLHGHGHAAGGSPPWWVVQGTMRNAGHQVAQTANAVAHNVRVHHPRLHRPYWRMRRPWWMRRAWAGRQRNGQ